MIPSTEASSLHELKMLWITPPARRAARLHLEKGIFFFVPVTGFRARIKASTQFKEVFAPQGPRQDAAPLLWVVFCNGTGGDQRRSRDPRGGGEGLFKERDT